MLLALGVLAAPLAQAQTPALTGLTVSAVSGSSDKLDVSWNAWTPKPEFYRVNWKSSGQLYDSSRLVRVQNTPTENKTSAQITGLTANTEYDVRVQAVSSSFATLAQSEATATTNATAVEYLPFPDLVGSTTSAEGTTLVFRVRLYDRSSFTLVGAPPGGLTVNVTVSDTTTVGADFLAPANEGAKTLTFREGQTTATLSIPTVDDNQDEPNGKVSFTLVAGNGYSLGVSGTTVEATIQDNDAPVPNLTVTPVSGNGDKLNVSWSAPTGVAFSGYSVLWKTKSQTYRRGSRTGSASFLASTTSYQITGLTPGTEYDVLVNALSASLSAVAGSATSATTHSNRAPAFLEQYYFFELAENNDGSATPVSLGTVSATDPDGGTVSYSITDGNTGNKFAISSTGAITYTGSGENYEGFRRNRAGFGGPELAFGLTVQASDAGGASDAATVTIRVTDVDEPPAKPAAPTVSPRRYSTTSLDVNWERPANGGPPITGYDLRYREGNSGNFTDGPQDVTGMSSRMSARITGLTAGRSYQVQVRATNEEGDGAWSNSGMGTVTSAPPSVVDGVTGINLTLDKNSIDEGGQAQWIRATVSLLGQTRSTATSVTFDGEGITTHDDILAWAIHKTITIPANARSVTTTLGITPRDDLNDEDPETFRIIAVAAIGGYELIDKEVVTIVDNDLPWLTGLRARGRGRGKLDVSWNALSGLTSGSYNVRWRIDDQGWDSTREKNVTVSGGTHPTSAQITGLAPGINHYVLVRAFGSGNALLARASTYAVSGVIDEVAAAPPGQAPDGVGTATLTGLTVSPVSGEPAQLAVSWEAVQDAARYDVRWKTGAGDYGDAVQASTNSHTITGLAAGTAYTVNVAALDADNALLAEGTASGTTAAATGAIGTAQFTVYHDPRPSHASAAAGSRYDTAVGLLKAASRSYAVRTVTGAGEVNRLARVENSVMPRFFLGDPAEEGWGPSEPGVNNGGLKWLRKVLLEQQESSPPPAPTVTVAAGAAVDEGTAASFTVTLSQAAPTDGLTLAYTVSEDGAFVAASDEGAKTLSIAGGATSATLSVATADDDGDEPDGKATVTLDAGTGYEVGDPSNASVTVRDDDEPVAAPAAFTVYHDPNAGAAAVARYQTAVGLLKAAGRSWAVRTVSGTAKVDGLAGVSGSVLPRFFLGDPEAEGWGPARAKVNNGGLKWLRSALGQTQASSASAGTVSVSVADASARESSGSIAFAVTLSAAAREAVSVDWATRDGTATSGTDYTAASGTLSFAAGETRKSVTVTLLDDVHDEGAETFSLVLSNPRPGATATLADGTATGTISNADPLQKDWLARFGRAVASDAIAAVTARLEVPRDAGSHFTLGGHRIALDGSGGEPGLPPAPAFGAGTASWLTWSGDPAGNRSRTMTTRELLMGTSFRAVLGQGAGSQFTSWGQGASVSQFSSSGTGLSLSGEAATGAMGMDYERGRLLTGFAMTHSAGEGTAQGAGRVYAMGSSVTTMLPYARLTLSERLSAWGLAGTGSGSLSLELDGGAAERYGTDLSMTLAAMGVRGELVTPDEADGFALALKADAFWVRTESDSVSAPGVGNLAGAQAEASRVRAVLDGSRRFALADGGTLTPSATLGLRHDGGDAETGTGVELGAGIGYADPSRGLDMALRVHGLAAHAADGYSEWGVSGSIRLVPGGTGRGLSASLTPSYGADPGSRDRLWMLSDASGLAADDDAPLSSRLDAELGYGIAMFGGGFTGTPNVGFGLSDTVREYRMGWRLSSAGWPSFSLGVEAARRKAVDDHAPEHRVGLETGFRW